MACLNVAIQLILLSPAYAQGEAPIATRVALVIGNGAYQNAEHLANPVNDARDTAEVLGRIGFTVTQVDDVNFLAFRNAILEFKKAAQSADIAIVYFAGHGIEVDGENWLLPIDAELRNDADVSSEAIGLQFVMRTVEPAKTLGLVILDACRNNPFRVSMKRGKQSRGVGVGLAPVDASDNVLVVYASRQGTVALDGMGKNSPFTAALLRHLETPGIEVDFLFRNVRDDVIAATDQQQQPVVYGSLSSDEIFLVPPLNEATADSDQPDAAEVAWSFLSDSGETLLLKEFVERFKGNRHTEEAEQRIGWLESHSGSGEKDLRTAAPTFAAVDSKELQTETKITARRFRHDSPVVNEAWEVVKQTRDQKLIRRFADQFPSRERRIAANKRLADLGQQPIRFNLAALPSAGNESPEQIQQALIGRAALDSDVLSCLSKGGADSCGRALVKYPTLGQFLAQDSFTTSVCTSLKTAIADCRSFIATSPTVASIKNGGDGVHDQPSTLAGTAGNSAASTVNPAAETSAHTGQSGQSPSQATTSAAAVAPASVHTPTPAATPMPAPTPTPVLSGQALRDANYELKLNHAPGGNGKTGNGKIPATSDKAEPTTGTSASGSTTLKPDNERPFKPDISRPEKANVGVTAQGAHHSHASSARIERSTRATASVTSTGAGVMAARSGSDAARVSATSRAASQMGSQTASLAASRAAAGAGRAASAAASRAASAAAGRVASNAASRAASEASGRAAATASRAASEAAARAVSRIKIP